MAQLEFNTTQTSLKVKLTVPFGAKVRFTKNAKGRLYFAFAIGGHLYRPQLADIHRIQAMYGVKSYACVAEFMQGETLVLIRTHE
jgi:hypothetical protein